MKYPQEDSIKIAHFMGMVFTPTNTILLDKTVKPQRVFKVDDLKYHSDWSWLMQVVERIEQLGLTHIDIGRGGTRIHSYSLDSDSCIYDDYPKLNFEEATKIIITFRAVVRFIDWLNKKD